jgi:CRISPR/Cas system Type II protein with McrA/HNH and RuvC-like nuclease domain
MRRFNESSNKYNRYLSSEDRLKKATENDKKVWLMSLIKRDNNICAICGKQCDLYDYEITDIGTMLTGDNYPSIDHIIPLSKGGLHNWDNVQLAHRKCNRKKSDKIE